MWMRYARDVSEIGMSMAKDMAGQGIALCSCSQTQGRACGWSAASAQVERRVTDAGSPAARRTPCHRTQHHIPAKLPLTDEGKDPCTRYICYELPRVRKLMFTTFSDLT